MTHANSTSPEIGDLVRHSMFLRRLAARLVSNTDDRDDLIQDVCMRALKSPPRSAIGSRGFLARVMHRQRANMLRSRSTRSQIDGDSTEQAMSSPTAEVVVQREAVQLVADAVVTLPDAHYEIITLRFYQGLSVQEIATRLEISSDATRKRLQRAVAMLREYLGPEFRKDGSRHFVLVALAGQAASAARVAKPTSPLLSIGILGAVVICALSIVLMGRQPEDSTGNWTTIGEGAAARPAEPSEPAEALERGDVSLDGTQNHASVTGGAPWTDGPTRVDPAAILAATTHATLQGSIRCAAGPMPTNARIVVESVLREEAKTVSAAVTAGGEFLVEFPLDESREIVRLRLLDGKRQLEQRLLAVTALGRSELRIVVGSGFMITGLVVDEHGAVRTDCLLRTRNLGGNLLPDPSKLAPESWRDHAMSPSGCFEITPEVGGRFAVEAVTPDGQRSDQKIVELNETSPHTEIRLHLRRPSSLAGTVVDSRGRAVSGARIELRRGMHTLSGAVSRSSLETTLLRSLLGKRRTTTNAAGEFLFTDAPDSKKCILVIAPQPHRPWRKFEVPANDLSRDKVIRIPDELMGTKELTMEFRSEVSGRPAIIERMLVESNVDGFWRPLTDQLDIDQHSVILRDLHPREEYRLTVKARGHALHLSAPLRIAGNTTHHQLMLPEPTTLELELVNAEGQALSFQSLELQRDAPRTRRPIVGRTDAHGRWSSGPLQPGRWVVRTPERELEVLHLESGQVQKRRLRTH